MFNIGFILVTMVLVVSASAAPIPFRAEYVVKHEGVPFKAKGIRELIKLNDNTYRFVSSAKSMLLKVVETSEFELNELKLVPTRYEYIRKGVGRNRKELSEFDWSSLLLVHRDTSSVLKTGTLDKLSYQYQLGLDVAHAITQGKVRKVLEYTVADGEKRRRYQFKISSEELVDTPMGELRTIRVDRVRQDSDRQTSFWLALDHEFLLVRLKQVEKGKGFELKLKKAWMIGNLINQ